MITHAKFVYSSNRNTTHVLYKDGNDFASTSEENYNSRVRDVRAIVHYYKHDGFNSLADCMEYIKRDAFRYNDSVCEIAIVHD